MNYKVFNWHLSPPLRKETAASGPACFAARQLRADLITAFKIFTGLFDIDPNLTFLLPTRRGLRGHPYRGTVGYEPPPEERTGLYGWEIHE